MQNKILAICCMIVFLYPVNDILAQPEFIPPESTLVNDRYYEGLRRTEQIGDGNLVLSGLIAHNSQVIHINPEGGEYHLNFPIPPELANQELYILIEDSQRNYFVIPKDRHFPAGYASFRWDKSRLTDSLHLTPNNLRVTICGHTETRGMRGMKLFIPGQIDYFARQISPLGYHFFFVANTPIRYSFYLYQENNLLCSETSKDWIPKGQIIKINGAIGAFPSGFFKAEMIYYKKNGSQGKEYVLFYHYNQ